MTSRYNPMNKEFQDKAEEFGLNGYQYYRKLVEEGKLPNPTDIYHEDREKWAKDHGFEGWNDYQRKCRKDYKREWTRKWAHDTGRSISMSENKDCASWLGVNEGEPLFEKFLKKIFEYVEKTDYLDGGIDFNCKKPRQEFINKYPHLELNKLRDEECTLQLRIRCLTFYKNCDWSGWKFNLDNNNSDFTILCGYDNRDNLEPVHIWMFYKNNIIRNEEFWKKKFLTITDTPNSIKQFEKFELKEELNIIKELM